ncbi:succinylglutamate desuccinylase/aspartoacylase family protein [Halarchaeum nitratireducens]|uniref:Succinate dehydrogenase n=1 Tax=Halarchaeum nitratireducens TaxID=489913 RepID=A0A830GBF0_9EURY|nr:succinylglutamate desuccinylase/aspartoacylase family protein [Halarchaeum nitratireducens]GGN18893.1 succinate dehydrogenase [Halarchaeum nitratireducens]
MATPFEYGGGSVPPGEVRHARYAISETFLGDPIRVPVTVVNGERDGPSVFISAAVHGDELNGVKVAHDVAVRYDPADLAGTLLIVHVVNPPGYLAQQRYLPIYDQDLNRSFPGSERSTPAQRIANELYRGLFSHCDYGIDLHTSTRGRTTMFHTRAQTEREGAARLAEAFGANVVLAGIGEEDNSIRSSCTNRGTPTITVEMGEAHRFQRAHVERASAGIESALTELGMYDGERLEPTWRRVVNARTEKAWVRSDAGGLVDLHVTRASVVEDGEAICTVHDHFGTERHVVRAPFTGLVVGLLQNPVAQPGHPVCHLVSVDEETRAAIDAESA